MNSDRARGTRSGCTESRISRGFSLIELMVVVSIISISAAITFSSIQADRFKNKARDFGEKVESEIIRTRDLAMAEQTRYDMTFSREQLLVERVDPVTGARTTVGGVHRDRGNDGLLVGMTGHAGGGANSAAGVVCIRGVYGGVQPPSRADTAEQAIPGPRCTSFSQALPDVIRFHPDGSFSIDGEEGAFDGLGATVAIADDRTTPGVFTLIEIYPGGLVRKLDDIRP